MNSEIKELLQKNKLRITPLRKAVLELLHKEHGPFSIANMLERLAKNGFTPNKSTLYRQLAPLLSMDLIQEVNLGAGEIKYELKTHHHHHFLCKSCEKIIEVSSKALEKTLRAIEKWLQKEGNSQLMHNVLFQGFCKNCKATF